MTIKNSVDQFVRSSSTRLANNTVKIYEQNLRKFENFVGKENQLKDISNFDIENFQIKLKENYCEKTQQNYANTIRTYIKFWYGLRETDVSWERIRSPRVPEKLASFISLEQFQKIDKSFVDSDYNQLTKKLIFHLLWNTGMRIGELIALNISDIDSTKKYAYILTEKSKKLRVVMWNDECHNLLLKYLGVRICLNNSSELFQTPNSVKNKRRTRLTARSVQRWCKETGNSLGFRVNPHGFRHGKCHFVLDNGGSRNHIQVIAGHASIQSSETYVRLNINEQRKVHERFLPKSFTKPSKPFYYLVENTNTSQGFGLSTG